MSKILIAFFVLSIFLLQPGCELTEKTVDKGVESPGGGGGDGNDDLALDTDSDGLTNGAEITHGTNPDNPDTDGDGLSDGAEVLTHGTNPLLEDSDSGGVNDSEEINNGTDPLASGDDFNPPIDDADEDGLSRESEEFIGTDPDNPDTDGDGLSDGAEVKTHLTSPLLADTDNGGIDDGKEVDFGTNPLDTNDDRLPDPPAIVFTSTPDQETTSTSASFKYKLVRFENVQRVECRIDNAFVECRPNREISFDNLRVGNHNFSVLVMDEDDHIFSATYRWQVIEPAPVDPCDPSRTITEKHTVEFEPSTSTCEFGANGNSPKKNGFITARKVDEFSLELPAGSTLCDVDIGIASQSFRYDDDFALTVNGIALIANGKDILSEDDGLFIFDFDAVKDKRFGNDEKLCFGEDLGSTCTMPSTDRNGTIEMDLNSSALSTLVSRFSNQTEHRMSLVTIGDNDNSDCKHSGLEVDVSVTYGTAL